MSEKQSPLDLDESIAQTPSARPSPKPNIDLTDNPAEDPGDPFREGREAVAAFRQTLGAAPDQAQRDPAPDLVLDPAEVARLGQNFFADFQGEPPPPPRLVQGIIFDFDNTLAQLGRPIHDLMVEGGKNAVGYMRATGMDLYDTFWEQMIEARTFAEFKSDEEQEEHIANDTLSFLLQFFNYPASRMDPNVLKSAVDMFYAPEMVAWQLLPQAKETLAELQSQGYKLALIAHYSCERVFQRIVDYLGLRPYFDLVVCSAGVEWRKPVPDIFQLAATRWDAMPHELVVVGDSLAHDILGGLELGAMTVQTQLVPGPISEADALLADQIAPDATITSLDQLPGIIHEWAMP